MFSGAATTSQRQTFSGTVIVQKSVLVTEFRSWVYFIEVKKNFMQKKERIFNPNHQNFLASTTVFHKFTMYKTSKKIEPKD